MKFRYARHTSHLAPLIRFYTKVIGLEILGSFENHSNYQGVFLGFKDKDWHLEFTQSTEPPTHHPDADDLIVFYVLSKEQLKAIEKDALQSGIQKVVPENPYWRSNAIELKDPDGYGVILTVKTIPLSSGDPLTQLLIGKGITNMDDLLNYIRALPYGRNKSRTVFEEVIKENRGTCSTKHALVKKVAEYNTIRDVKLILCMYQMKESNTKGISKHLSENKLDHLPEAHCYIKINGKSIDLTNPAAELSGIKNDILEETEIEADQVGDFKITYHQEFIKKWIAREKLTRSFEEIWTIREKCITQLSG